MFFGRVRVINILLSLLLIIWNFIGVSGLVLAQSLLSDRVWLEQKIDVFFEKDGFEPNLVRFFSITTEFLLCDFANSILLIVFFELPEIVSFSFFFSISHLSIFINFVSC